MPRLAAGAGETALLLAAAHLIGSLCLARLRAAEEQQRERFHAELIVGLGFLATLFYLLGAAGCFTARLPWLLQLLGLVGAWRLWRATPRPLVRALRGHDRMALS